MRVKELAAFIKKREEHRLQKLAPPRLTNWVPDPIIAKYRFCNVIRADDRVTGAIWQWAIDNDWAYDNPDLWFAFVVARLFNNPGTLDAVARYVLPYKPAGMSGALAKRKLTGEKLFNAAYTVSTNGRAMDKVEYVLIRVLQPLWAGRKKYRPRPEETLESFHSRLQEAQGMGSFMAAQVVADLKYFRPFWDPTLGIPTSAASDWWTFAASGPGSRRGLNRVMNTPTDGPYKEAYWRRDLALLHRALLPLLPAAVGTRLTSQDTQNCLCEFDKYERARLGEGTPKQIYKPHQEEKK